MYTGCILQVNFIKAFPWHCDVEAKAALTATK